MTSKRKATSNRTNAQRGSGPRTGAGKMHSSRNARKHGLAVPIRSERTWAQRIESLALEIAGDDADRSRLEEARNIAEAELDVVRVRATRTRLLELSGIARLDRPQPEPKPQHAHDLFAGDEFLAALEQMILLDRYERRALARRNRATRRLF
jgi:hypothetical protein